MNRNFAASAALGALLLLAGCAGGGGDSDEKAGQPERIDLVTNREIARGPAQDEETDEHSPAMEAQHETMQDIAEQWAKARAAALGGNATEAVAPAMKMHEDSAAIEGFMLHRGRENGEEFKARSLEFKSLVMRFTAYAQKGDVISLRETAPEIDKACNGCHQAYR